ncbi:type II toxin-antitoxin system YafQ family toxin [Patescibacteria group bacterium]|nr:type II toxin-antitoxin system YafQ family toxin [Patescibacteria group bacterium]MBU1124131.1 type II toxin-antitoxin system YafQ family toxin [Patescibacteria group bacterium]
MRIPKSTKRFRRDYKRIKKSGKDIEKLKAIMLRLIQKKTLPSEFNDHQLHGKWKYLRDCHVEGDWILLYELGVDNNNNETITFHATNNHENLFG